MTQYVICALQMEGFHCWPEADGELAYLKNSHRHIFFITAEFPVHNANREIEIISQQNATAQRVVKYGFIGQIFATACIMITSVFPATDAVMDNAYQTLLGQNWIFVIGSLSAYLVSQSWDVAVFHAIRDRYIAKHGSTKGGRWLWNNGSTITSQIWDTVIYAVISFGFGLGWVHTHEGRMQLIGIIIGQYLLKACLALLDTPFFYFFTRNADRR